MRLLRIVSTKINSNGQLEIKVQGAKATYTAEEYAPHGTDARPPKNMAAVYSETQADGDDVILGMLVADRKAETGEHRIFSTDDAGAFKANVWLRADGVILIGDSNAPSDYDNYAVKFNELKTEFDKLKADYNDLKTKYNAHTHTTSCGAGAGTAAAVLPVSQGSTNTSNIDNCKHDNVQYSE